MKKLILVLAIYLTFIALGLPDALLGSAWNQVRIDFNIPISTIGFVTFTTYLFTIIATFFAPQLLKVFQTKAIAFVSIILSGTSLILMSFMSEYIYLVLLAILLGLGAGAIDLSINHYVAKHLNQSHMSYLHTFYGVGVMSGPFIMSIVLNRFDWRLGFILVGAFLLLISVVLLSSFKWWEKETSEEKKDMDIGFFSALTTKGVIHSIIIFVFSVHIESFLGIFIATYAYVALGFDIATSAIATFVFYLGLTLGRLVSGLFSKKIHASTLILIGESVVIISAMALFFIESRWAFIVILLLGLGSAPIYPNMMYLNKSIFNKTKLSRIMSLQMMIGYVGFGIITPLLGILIDVINIRLYPIILLSGSVMLLSLSYLYLKRNLSKGTS